MSGTIIVSSVLISIVSLAVASIVKDKRSGRHPSCGGNCGSCGHTCSAYKNASAFLEKQKAQK
ncbi:MAG: FeoB-associated Cys-rich membrane protein [Treponema sp.]|nr:FeoB-associated Cys-rich membrane protein [Treponema sp.]MBQ5434000.1 FeoB-associated Cys-rich membrane protein [Treponema sp.]